METDAPHEAPSAVQNPRAGQGNGTPLKLRASCDHCSNGKVRCDQDRPSCQRCLNAKIPCNYSASRRMGKPAVSVRSGNDKFKATTSTRRNSKEESYSADTTSESSDSPKNNTHQRPDTGLDPYGQDFDYAASQPWNDANFMSDLPGSFDFASFSNPQANASHITQPQLATNQLQTPLPSSDPLNFATTFHNNANPNPICIHLGAGQSTFQQISPSLLTTSKTLPDQARSIGHQSASCIELASSTIHSLSLPSNMCVSSPQPIPLHTIEQVLAAGRGAISAFNILLQCTCSHSSSFALTLALMITKMLAGYSAICRCSASSPTSCNLLRTPSPAATSCNSRVAPSLSEHLTPSSSSTALTTPTSIPRGPHNIVLDTPITIGGYKIDPDDEYVFILQIVLSELRKVAKLVDAFAVQYSAVNPNACAAGSANEAMNGVSDCGEESVYKSLEHFLRCQVNKARREVGTVLRRSEEGS